MDQHALSNCIGTSRLTPDDGKDRFARENHSEIERRRRNKMTHYINGKLVLKNYFYKIKSIQFFVLYIHWGTYTWEFFFNLKCILIKNF